MLSPLEIRGCVPATEFLQEQFHGARADDTCDPGTPKQVCLHEENSGEVAPHVRYDIDSFMGFASSLGIARYGISWQLVPLMVQNIKTDVHIQADLFAKEGGIARWDQVPLKKIPHIILGRIRDSRDTALYVFFPRLEHGVYSFVALTGRQLERWLDLIMIPAVRRHYGSDHTQHIPANSDHAKSSSRASKIEDRRHGATNNTQKMISYHLQASKLHELWLDIQEVIGATPGLGDFDDAQLFFSAKGTKLDFEGDVTYESRRLHSVIDSFLV